MAQIRNPTVIVRHICFHRDNRDLITANTLFKYSSANPGNDRPVQVQQPTRQKFNHKKEGRDNLLPS